MFILHLLMNISLTYVLKYYFWWRESSRSDPVVEIQLRLEGLGEAWWGSSSCVALKLARQSDS